jgi:hypothetical protein
MWWMAVGHYDQKTAQSRCPFWCQPALGRKVNMNKYIFSSRSSDGMGFVGVLAIVFVTLKLLGYISWSWWWVLSPLWIAAILFVVVLLLVVLVIALKVR